MQHYKTIAGSIALFGVMLPITAKAQIPGLPPGIPSGAAAEVETIPGSVTSDQAAEDSLADIDQNQLPAILQQDTTTANALTQGGDAGIWQPDEAFLDSLGALIQQQLGLSYSDPQLIQIFEQLYPGYSTQQPPPVPQDSVQTNLNTLNGTLQDAKAQSQNWPSEQQQMIDAEANNAGSEELQAAQTGNEINLLSVSQQRDIRQLIMALLNSYNVNSATQQQQQTASQLSAMAIMGAPPQVLALAPPTNAPISFMNQGN